MRHSKAVILVRAFDTRNKTRLERVRRDLPKGVRLVRKDNRGRVVSNIQIDERKPGRKERDATPRGRGR